ncbi:hypothetical protein [uncultured Parabacteroides sp.]|uniref:hypothetical protein n=1 Tax=uncultured Parabacteroides sp. TaxID=512312 RepID=UPI0026EBE061|nr:hypothetical protein [uncultured Parabacteroides sp.]
MEPGILSLPSWPESSAPDTLRTTFPAAVVWAAALYCDIACCHFGRPLPLTF